MDQGKLSMFGLLINYFIILYNFKVPDDVIVGMMITKLNKPQY